MNKKIKIIDLLNKIANGEEVPKKIKYSTLIYKFNENCNQFYEEGKGSYYDSKLKYEGSIEWQFYGDYLNDEVEILEDNTEEIEELNDTCYDRNMTGEEREYYHNITREKINELVKAVNEIRKDKNND
jgi:hypothetical protein